MPAFHIYTVEEIAETNSVEFTLNISSRNFQNIDAAKKEQYVIQAGTYVFRG
ncbi:MAG: hypothetical protein M3232_01275 [Thermoproteota archaeon]|nr:hypothetical protein [Thermoproteota archaeon]